MVLEVIDKGAVSAQHPAPLLFVHGAAHAAWCWDDHFLGYFADRGYRAVALSLRGHGASNSVPVHGCSIADFVADVHEVAAGLDSQPVVIGHSMGGFVVQRYLTDHAAPAAVLVASVPPTGVAGALVRTAMIRMRMRVAHPRTSVDMAEYLGALFFHPITARNIVSDCLTRLSTETPTRALLDMTVPMRRNRPPGMPVMVLGAAQDRSVSRAALRATASAYRTHAEVLPAMGHDIMLEPGWETGAARIHGWLGSHGL